MRLKKCILHNVFKFGETQNEVDFDKLFKDDDIALIIGSVDSDEDVSNGAGKSSIGESIYWAFYEQLPRLMVNSDKKGAASSKIVRTIDDRGNIDCKKSYVELYFDTEDGKEWRYLVGRNINKSQKQTPFVELECDKEDINSLKKKEPTELVRGMLGASADAFLNSILFAQKDSGKFLSGTGKSRRDILMNLLGLHIIDDALSVLRENHKKKSKQIIDKLQAQIDLCQDRVEGFSAGELRKRKMELAANIELINGESKKSETEILNLENAQEFNDLEDAKKSLGKSKEELKEVEYQKEIASSKIKNELSTIKSKRGILVDEKQRINEQKSILEQKFSRANSVVEQYTKDGLKSRKNKIDEAKSENSNLQGKLEQNNFLKNSVSGTIGEIQGRINSYKEEISSIEGLMKSPDGDKVNCPTCSSECSTDSLQAKIEEKRSEIEKQNSLKSEKEVELSSINSKIDAINNRIKEVSIILKDESVLASNIESLKAANETIKECRDKAELIKNRLPEIDIEVAGHDDSIKTKNELIEKTNGLYEERIKSLTEDVSKCNKEIESIEEKINVVKYNINKLRESIKEDQDKKGNLSKEIGQIEEKMSANKRDEDDLARLKSEMEDEQKNSSRIAYLEKILSTDAKNDMAESCVPLLNYYTQDFLSVVNPSMHVVIDNDSKDMPIRVSGGTASVYELLSGGEKDVIRLVVNMGLSMISIGGSTDLPDMIFLDEIFGALDNRTRGLTFNLLQRLKKYFPRILVITHDPVLKDKFGTILRIDKTNDISRIIQ